ncbi:hypothetical protein CEXT_77191 [Caerostris extrusa]|uniref:Uncharacterized protein n=1 Tax=Caerostris extrusa TaxID=172846 RepID=A0AAV4P802_CAEEX|nr:hypothetical protein CEXT_77191 [Caerostris extrusa]
MSPYSALSTVLRSYRCAFNGIIIYSRKRRRERVSQKERRKFKRFRIIVSLTVLNNGPLSTARSRPPPPIPKCTLPTSVIYGVLGRFDVDDDKRTLNASEKEATTSTSMATERSQIKLSTAKDIFGGDDSRKGTRNATLQEMDAPERLAECSPNS